MTSNNSLIKAWNRLDLALKTDEEAIVKPTHMNEPSQLPSFFLSKTPSTFVGPGALKLRPSTAKSMSSLPKAKQQFFSRPTTALMRPQSGVSNSQNLLSIDTKSPSGYMSVMLKTMTTPSNLTMRSPSRSELRSATNLMIQRYSPKSKYIDESTAVHSVVVGDLTKIYEAKCYDNKNDFNSNQHKHFIDRFDKFSKKRAFFFEDQGLGHNAALVIANVIAQNDHFLHLKLSKNFIGDKGASYIAQALTYNKILIDVDLSSNNIGNEGAFQILESLKVNNTIISVKLNSYEGMFRNRIDARGLRGIEDVLQINKTLQLLNLSGSGIGYEGCRILARGLEDNESLLSLDISNNELGPNIALPLAKSLITSQVIELNIAGNKLGDTGALNLFYMFSTGAPRNAVIQNLDISSNNISTMGASRIFDALGRNGSVKEFNISNNNLGGKGIVSLANLFWDNRTIKVFQISNCDLGFDGADAIATGLTKNLCIESLNVSKNTFKDEGAIAIAAALKENTHIKSLDMSGCRIREEGGKALADYIKGSGTLVKIELKDNTLYDEAGRALHEAMKQNQILRKMSLDRNPIGYTYLHEIQKKLEQNLQEFNNKKTDVVMRQLTDLRIFERQKYTTAEQKKQLDTKQVELKEEIAQQTDQINQLREEEFAKHELLEHEFQDIWHEIRRIEKAKESMDFEMRHLNDELSGVQQFCDVNTRKNEEEILLLEKDTRDMKDAINHEKDKYEKQIEKLHRDIKEEERKIQLLEHTVEMTENQLRKLRGGPVKRQQSPQIEESKGETRNKAQTLQRQPTMKKQDSNLQRKKTVVVKNQFFLGQKSFCDCLFFDFSYGTQQIITGKQFFLKQMHIQLHLDN